jgi:hypothetical protein
MRKVFKFYGATLVLTFSKEDKKIFNIEAGDIADLSDIRIIKQGANQNDTDGNNTETKS